MTGNEFRKDVRDVVEALRIYKAKRRWKTVCKALAREAKKAGYERLTINKAPDKWPSGPVHSVVAYYNGEEPRAPKGDGFYSGSPALWGLTEKLGFGTSCGNGLHNAHQHQLRGTKSGWENKGEMPDQDVLFLLEPMEWDLTQEIE